MNIRAYKEEDLPQIFEIYSQSKLDELRFEEKKFSLLPLEQDPKRFRELMESDIYICHKDNIIHGYGALFGNEIRALFVRSESRGKGIGRRLLELLLSHISSDAFLYVASTNHPAKKLYGYYDFNVTDTFKTTYNKLPVFAQKMVRSVNN